MDNECKNCDDDCSGCAIFLGKNGKPFGYGAAQGYDNSGE